MPLLTELNFFGIIFYKYAAPLALVYPPPCRERLVRILRCVRRQDVPLLVEKAKIASSMRGNPVVLTDEELTSIVHASLG